MTKDDRFPGFTFDNDKYATRPGMKDADRLNLERAINNATQLFNDPSLGIDSASGTIHLSTFTINYTIRKENQ